MEIKRRKLTKSDRETIWRKYGGRCAYCGSKITPSEMQADHIKSLAHGGSDTLDNMNPSCRLCNHYKRNAELDSFRNFFLDGIVERLRKIYIFRVAEKYGMVTVSGWNHRFYFEAAEPEAGKDNKGGILYGGKRMTDEEKAKAYIGKISEKYLLSNAELGCAKQGYIDGLKEGRKDIAQTEIVNVKNTYNQLFDCYKELEQKNKNLEQENTEFKKVINRLGKRVFGSQWDTKNQITVDGVQINPFDFKES